MSDPTRPYEPLTSENAVLILIDHQVGLITGVRDYSTGELKHNVVGLAKAAKALKLPIIVTTTARDSMWGPTFPELVEALPGVPIIDRSSVNAFDDPKVAQAITATGRKKPSRISRRCGRPRKSKNVAEPNLHLVPNLHRAIATAILPRARLPLLLPMQ